MPTSRALARSAGATASFRTGPILRFWFPLWVLDGGGQSVVARSEMLPSWSASGAGTWTTCFGLTASGHSGKSPAVAGETWWRRVRKLGVDAEGTGDKARLTAPASITHFIRLVKH